MTEKTRVVAIHATLGRWCQCTHAAKTAPNHVAQITPGMKGTVETVVNDMLIVDFDGLAPCVIIPTRIVRAHDPEGHNIE